MLFLKVFCNYNKEYDHFLKQVVEYVLEQYGSVLDIRNLKEIELVREIEDNKISDGRLEDYGTRIVIAERKYRQLPCLDIRKLKEEDTFKSVVSTLVHEMGHATDMVRMPSMYRQVYHSKENMTSESVATMLFLEYVANLRTDAIYTGEHNTFCLQVAKGMWNKYRDWPPEFAFYYMAKISVYFLVRTSINNNRDYYLKQLNDKLFSDFLEALDHALVQTYQCLPFDDSKKCFRIEAVLNEYIYRFGEKYG